MVHKGFFGKLFDFSFQQFITPTIVGILYGICVLVAFIIAIVAIVAGFQASTGLGIIALLLSPIVFLLYLVLFRVALESMVALVRIAQNTTDLLDRQ